GDGGYIVATPSGHVRGPRYQWASGRAPDEVDLADTPACLRELLLKEAQPAAQGRPIPPSLCVEHRDRARHYLAKIAPAISGSGGHAQTLLAAEHLVRGFNLDEETAFALLWNFYNPRCEPPW